MKKTLLLSALFLTAHLWAASPWKFTMKSPETKTSLCLDLYEESIEVPGLELLGPMHGYLAGGVYGVWIATSHEIQDSIHARIRFSNDLGSETQEAQLTLKGDSVCQMELKSPVVMKRIEGRKLVRIDSTLEFKK